METLLNLVWVLLALAGFAALLWQSRRSAQSYARIRFGHLIAVLLIVLSLFPAVSASDDALRYQFLFGAGAAGVHDHHPSTAPVSDGLVLNLVRFFDSLENSTAAAFATFVLLLLAGSIVGVRVVRLCGRSPLLRSGRAPPVAA